MDEQNLLEEVKRRLRHALNRDKVKLWLPPFTTERGEKGHRPDELIERYAASLNYTEEAVELALQELRQHAVEKLLAKQTFDETGIATVIVHANGDISTTGKKKFNKQIPLQVLGSEFKESLKQDLSPNVSEIKLVFKGKILNDAQTLESQHVINNSHIMALCIGQSSIEEREEQTKSEDLQKRIENIKKLADVLSKREDAGKAKHQRFYLEINDQNGKPLQLPEFERQSLSKAMALNELGRNLIKNKSYPEALLLLLEAEEAFRNCRSEILSAVDNYGVLCMDIVWCYLNMKNLEHLPDAELKLRKCRECLDRSYGSHLERATSLKGSSGAVAALFVRLYVLEAITAFHRRNYPEAKVSLDRAETEIKGLQVDDSKLSQLIAMGFTSQESRLALRSCQGDVTVAVNHITKRREEQKQRQEEEKRKAEKWRLSRKLGKTAKGNWVNTENYEYLTSMGFSKDMAAKALRQSDNSLDQALEILQNHPELLTIEDKRSKNGAKSLYVPDEAITQLMNMGFDYEMSRRALQQFDADVLRAANELLANGGVLPTSSGTQSTTTDEDSMSSSSADSEEERDAEIDHKIAETMGELSKEEEDYLDFSFVEEISLISEYRALLRSISS